jgi:hypothetical protein
MTMRIEDLIKELRKSDKNFPYGKLMHLAADQLEDYISHHNDWKEGCAAALAQSTCADDDSYWEHQLEVLNRLEKARTDLNKTSGT